MDKDNKQWEKLISMPEEYERTPELAQKAIAEINEKKSQVKKNWFELHWKKMAVCAASLALIIGIGIPVYQKVTAPPPVVYYASNDLVFDTVLDVSTFVPEKGLNIGFFNVSNSKTQSGTIMETGKIALLYQKFDYIDINEGIYDQIEFNVVLEKNLTLDFYKEYLLLKEKTTVAEVVVDYQASIMKDGSQQIYAKFTYENAEYYLNIVTFSEIVECINTYVKTLIG